METLLVVRLGTCLHFFLTLTFGSHIHTTHSPPQPPTHPRTPQLSPVPVTAAANDLIPVQLQPLAGQGDRCLGPSFLSTTRARSPPLLHPAHFPPPVQHLPPPVTHSSLVCSINICYNSSAFIHEQVFVPPSFSFSTVCLSVPPTTQQPDDQTEI